MNGTMVTDENKEILLKIKQNSDWKRSRSVIYIKLISFLGRTGGK